ncbi:DUF3310 domain-containing protein [Geobacillus sp. LEMMY01]|uniref:DUF3310 domain-containing protein n=1 Tax=Geobacillus sp. LEMMY01 TaxID=1954237 RepID=UPI0009AEB330|nr:DUF3310 domain-containing protein [Geobacillus sp. LEMMY01]OPW98350.1 hypothetical protein B1A75_19010 [Geobacillus sp. LEMMY01]
MKLPKQEDVRPDYYKVGGIEPIDYMKAKMTPEQFEGFCLGNVYKYTGRYLYKGGLTDLKKARYYLELLIEVKGESDERSDR